MMTCPNTLGLFENNLPRIVEMLRAKDALLYYDGRFVQVGHLAGMASFKRGRGGLLVDLNGDGLLDMVVVNRWDKAQLWRHVGSGTADKPAPMGHWLQLRLRQPGGNRDAVGAWVEVDLGGRIIRRS